MPAKTVTNSHLAELIASGQQTSKEWREDMRADIDAKHKENIDRRHALMGKLEGVQNEVHVHDGRIRALETQLVSVIGDNSGGSGLLHEIDRKVDSLTGEVAAIKKTVEDTPSINKWVYGAMAVAAVVGAIVLAVIGAGAIELFKALLRP